MLFAGWRPWSSRGVVSLWNRVLTFGMHVERGRMLHTRVISGRYVEIVTIVTCNTLRRGPLSLFLVELIGLRATAKTRLDPESLDDYRFRKKTKLLFVHFCIFDSIKGSGPLDKELFPYNILTTLMGLSRMSLSNAYINRPGDFKS